MKVKRFQDVNLIQNPFLKLMAIKQINLRIKIGPVQVIWRFVLSTLHFIQCKDVVSVCNFPPKTSFGTGVEKRTVISLR